MYARYPNYRRGGGIRVPENYSGNAFFADEPQKEPTESDVSEPQSAAPTAESVTESADAPKDEERSEKEEGEDLPAKTVSKPFRLPSFGFDALKLFSGGFGFEELLLVALILLISSGDGDDDLILLLALLLFVR